jgi:ketosteroid isomerase-like protein
MKAPREGVQDWVAAYNQRYAYAAAELYQENATNLQVALGNPTIGRRC